MLLLSLFPLSPPDGYAPFCQTYVSFCSAFCRVSWKSLRHCIDASAYTVSQVRCTEMHNRTVQGNAWCCLHVVISGLRSLLALLSATDLNFMWCVDSWWLRWHSPPPPCWFSWACISKQKQDSFHRWQQKSYAVSKSFKCTAASKRTASFRADWLHYFDKETTWQMWFSRTEIDTDKITVLPLLPDKRDV